MVDRSLLAENDGLRNALQALNVKCASMHADINIMIPLQNSLQAENEVLRDKAKTVCAENEGLRQALQALNVKCASMAADLDIMIPLQNSLQSENDNLREKTQTLCNQNDALQQERSTLESCIEELQKRLEEARTKVFRPLQTNSSIVGIYFGIRNRRLMT
jgi:chromosome segregation ATPase